MKKHWTMVMVEDEEREQQNPQQSWSECRWGREPGRLPTVKQRDLNYAPEEVTHVAPSQ